MLKPNEIERFAMLLDPQFKALEMRIMEDIIRRIRINGEITSAADWQIVRLYELGKPKREIKKIIQRTLKLDKAEISHLYKQVIRMGYARSRELYKAKGRPWIPFEDNYGLQQLIAAVAEQTDQTLQNITQSLGFAVRMPSGQLAFQPIAEYYQKTLDSAMLDISSGAFDYNTVLKRTVKELTNSGLRTVDYASGHSNRVEVAARRAVMTGLTQLTDKVTEDNARALGTDMWEITWHSGARPTHWWGGRWYNSADLVKVCGYGTVTGLCGANCYHQKFPVIPGISVPAYSQEELEKLNAEEQKPREFGGKTYTKYEALQHQRRMETTMRAQRQEIRLLQDGGAKEEDITAARARYRGTSAEYTRFSETVDLPQQRERVTVDGLGNIGVGKYTNGSDRKAMQQRVGSHVTGTVSGQERAELLEHPRMGLKFLTNGSESGIIESEEIRRIRDEVIPSMNTSTIALRQAIHRQGTKMYLDRQLKLKSVNQYGPSYLTISDAEILELVAQFKGKGEIYLSAKNSRWNHQEVIITNDKIVGVAVNNLTGKEVPTSVFKIHYGDNGIHIVPDYPSKKKRVK